MTAQVAQLTQELSTANEGKESSILSLQEQMNTTATELSEAQVTIETLKAEVATTQEEAQIVRCFCSPRCTARP